MFFIAELQLVIPTNATNIKKRNNRSFFIFKNPDSYALANYFTKEIIVMTMPIMEITSLAERPPPCPRRTTLLSQ